VTRGGSRPVVLMFVGHYLPGYKAGGIITCVSNIADHLHKDFEFRIVTRDRDIGDERPYAGIQAGAWHQVGRASVMYLPPEELTLAGIRRVVEAIPHDLIYLTSFFEPMNVKLLFNLRLGRVRCGPIVLAPQGEFAWPSLRQKYPKKAVFMRLARLAGLYSPVRWHASTDVEADDIQRIMRIRPGAIGVAHQLPPAFADPGNADDRADASAGRDLRVAFLSRISPEKNLHLALDVLRRAKARVAFDIIGPIGNPAYWTECEKAIQTLPSNISVRSLGAIPSTDAIKVLSRYDLMLFPTGGESYGQVIAESLLAGTPVLISTETPWRELPKRGLGWDLPLEDLDAYVRVIDSLPVLDEAGRREKRSSVREAAARLLSESPAIANVRDLFQSSIESRGPRGDR
jgi:glycosyltransferase involved in cell wall biosynthesis